MSLQDLASPLEVAVTCVSDDSQGHRALPLAPSEEGKQETETDAALLSLRDAIRGVKELKIFDSKMQFLYGSGTFVTYDSLAQWMIDRARRSGAEDTLKGLERYIRSKEIEGHLNIAVCGIKVSRSTHLGNGVELVPWEELEESPQLRGIESHHNSQFRFPSCALRMGVKVTPFHVKDSSEIKRQAEPSGTPLTDAGLVLNVCTNTAPYTTSKWFSLPDWAPHFAAAWSTPGLSGTDRIESPTDQELEAASQLFQRFTKLELQHQDHLRIPMQRLMLAKRRYDQADRAIDLGICLESVLLTDPGTFKPGKYLGEISFRLRIRAAWYLGKTGVERKRIYQQMGALYSLRSEAVHQGKVKKSGRSVSDLLSDGYSIASEAIKKSILEGSPDWDQVVLDARFPEAE